MTVLPSFPSSPSPLSFGPFFFVSTSPLTMPLHPVIFNACLLCAFLRQRNLIFAKKERSLP
jgi:hypothetical protein